MSKSIECWFYIVSPASYRAWTQLPALLAETSAEIDYRPFFLPGVFKIAGSATPLDVPNKKRWFFDNLERWVRRYDVPFAMNPHFPQSSVYAARAPLIWRGTSQFHALAYGYFRAMLVDSQDINDPAIVAAILEHADIDPNVHANAMNDQANIQAVFDATEAFVKRGVLVRRLSSLDRRCILVRTGWHSCVRRRYRPDALRLDC